MDCRWAIVKSPEPSLTPMATVTPWRSAAAVMARTTGSASRAASSTCSPRRQTGGVAVDEVASRRAAHEPQEVVGDDTRRAHGDDPVRLGEVNAVTAGAGSQRRRDGRGGVEQLAEEVALQVPLHLLLRALLDQLEREHGGGCSSAFACSGVSPSTPHTTTRPRSSTGTLIVPSGPSGAVPDGQ
jgi:hypothetical protein